jgi:hypothetical protein
VDIPRGQYIKNLGGLTMALYSKKKFYPSIETGNENRYQYNYGKSGEKFYLTNSENEVLVEIEFIDCNDISDSEKADISGTISAFLTKKEFRETDQGELICSGFSKDFAVEIEYNKIKVYPMVEYHLIGKVKTESGLATNLVEEGNLLMQDEELDKFTLLGDLSKINQFFTDMKVKKERVELRIPVKRYNDSVLINVEYKNIPKVNGLSMVVKAIDAI